MFFSAERDLFPLPSHSEAKQPACGSPCSGRVSFPSTAAHIWCPSPHWNRAPQQHVSQALCSVSRSPYNPPEVVSSFDSHTYPHLCPMLTEYPIYWPSTDYQKISLSPVVARWWSWIWEIIQHQAGTGNHCSGVGTFEHQNLGQHPCSHTSWTGWQGADSSSFLGTDIWLSQSHSLGASYWASKRC